LALLTLLAQSNPSSLPVVGGPYPRAYFFRYSEGQAANPRVNYEQWDAAFSRLMGIEGKVLDEEIPGRSLRNIDFFTRFKKAHPDQLVMLHYNGNARDPRYERGAFFSGHFQYWNGSKILEDLPAAEGEFSLRVENPKLYRVNIGRYRDRGEDIALCALTDSGKPDWNRCEHVALLSMEKDRLRVKRAQYGSKPLAFEAGKAWAAAHRTEGPWGTRNATLLWHYNYSTRAPRDAQGRSATDVLVEDLARHFRAGGRLATLDGLQFDVLFHGPLREAGGRAPDCDGDGRPDSCLFEGINTYGLGVHGMLAKLRAALGPNKLLLADGHLDRHMRAARVVNGIESEGWPSLNDLEVKDWSGGLNRHFYWAARGAAPVFNYINHKLMEPQPGSVPKAASVPYGVHRTVFAAAMFTDAAVCYSAQPPAEAGEVIGIWDELWQGREKIVGWLGSPLGPAQRLAKQARDLLGGRIREMELGPSGGSEIQFQLPPIKAEGPDLTVFLRARAASLPGYPATMPRLAWLSNGTQRFMTWIDGEDFESAFYFSGFAPGEVTLTLTIEGGSPVWIRSVTAHAAPDAIRREFQRGLVVANPSGKPYSFGLGSTAFRRLQGSAQQDPATNNGRREEGSVTIPARDALFLLKEKPAVAVR
jgi:hypothetical protein